MAVQGKGQKSIRLSDQSTDKFQSLSAVKTLRFAHQATAGDDSIDLSALILPTGISYPNPGLLELQRADLFINRDKLTLVSDDKGVLIEDVDYTISASLTIDFTDTFGTAVVDERFFGTINTAISDFKVVDAAFIADTGELAIGEDEIVLGQSFRVNYNSSQQIGDVEVKLDGQTIFRNVGNATAAPGADGDYEEINSGDGTGLVIKLNNPVASPTSYSVTSTSAFTFRSEGILDQLEKINGTTNNLVTAMSVVTGEPESTYDGSPTNVQLSQFGDRLVAMERFKVRSSAYTATGPIDKILADTSGAAFTVTLPATPSVGDTVWIWDAAGTFDSNNLTVGRNGKLIEGAAADYTENRLDARIVLTFVSDARGWIIGDMT